MNFNIKKFQAGGVATTPLPFAQPEMPRQQQAPQAQPQSNSQVESKLGDKLIMELLGKGITNDVMIYNQELNNAANRYMSMSEAQKNTAEGRQLSAILSGRDFGRVNAIIQQKNSFKEGIENVKKNEAFDEFAVNSRGIVVYDNKSGKVGTIPVKDYASIANDSSNDRYRALTNAELINIREMSPQLAFDSSVFESLLSAKGMPSIQKEVDSYLTNLGKSVSSTTTNKYELGKNKEIAGAVNEIRDSVANGVFDVKQMVKQSSNSEQLKIALNSIWEHLTASSKQVLKARAVAKGVPGPELESYAKNSIALMIAGRSSDEIEKAQEINYSSDLSKATGDTKAAKEQLSDMGSMEALLAMSGEAKVQEFNTGTSTSFKAPAITVGSYREYGKATGPRMVNDMKELLSNVDINNITVGDSHVSKDKLNTIMYDGSQVYNARLPVMKDDKGHIVPDYKLAARKNAADKEINSLKFKDASTKKSIYAAHGIDTDDKGNPTYQQDQFIIFDGMAGEEALEIKDNSLYQEVEDSGAKDLFDQHYNYSGDTTNKSDKKKVPGRGVIFGMGPKNDIYRSKVALRVLTGALSGRFSDGNNLTIRKDETSPEYYRDNAVDYTVDTGQEARKRAIQRGYDELNTK